MYVPNSELIENICSVVAGELNVPENQLGSQSRKMELVNARHIAMYLSRELTNNSLLTERLKFHLQLHPYYFLC